MDLNDVKIAGNLVKEAELRYTPQGTPVANVSLGVNETYTVDNEKRTATTFVDVQLWGASAEKFSKLVQKGQQILVEGALRQDSWEDKQTKQARSKLFVRAER
jgi:single-strand DNA-binding protein